MPSASTETWGQVVELIDNWTLQTAVPAWKIKQATCMAYTQGDISYYWNPQLKQAALFGRSYPTKQDVAMCKAALDVAVGSENVRPGMLTFDEVCAGSWIKVAYSPAVRRIGELLNFFPGKFPGGVPNAPSPLAATLTSGLVGAGVGYGAGALGERVLPASWRNGRLKKTLATLGGVLGATPGAAWAYSAGSRGRSLLDGSDLAAPPGSDPALIDSFELPDTIATDQLRKQAGDVPLSRQYLEAGESYAKLAYSIDDTYMPTFGGTARNNLPPTSIDVNINKMGQTLWEVGATPQTTAATMGALYAAQQLPDRNARAGYVTPHQTGLLGTMMGAAGGGVKGYAMGYLAGKALNILTGAPVTMQNTMKRTGAALGVINAVVPRLYN